MKLPTSRHQASRMQPRYTFCRVVADFTCLSRQKQVWREPPKQTPANAGRWRCACCGGRRGCRQEQHQPQGVRAHPPAGPPCQCRHAFGLLPAEQCGAGSPLRPAATRLPKGKGVRISHEHQAWSSWYHHTLQQSACSSMHAIVEIRSSGSMDAEVSELMLALAHSSILLSVSR